MAGKKRDGGEVKVKITDGGSIKNLGKNAKKAGKDVGSVAKNVQESDRRLKSLSNQTSNSTKAFSKQAQTIGGGLCLFMQQSLRRYSPFQQHLDFYKTQWKPEIW